MHSNAIRTTRRDPSNFRNALGALNSLKLGNFEIKARWNTLKHTEIQKLTNGELR